VTLPKCAVFFKLKLQQATKDDKLTVESVQDGHGSIKISGQATTTRLLQYVKGLFDFTSDDRVEICGRPVESLKLINYCALEYPTKASIGWLALPKVQKKSLSPTPVAPIPVAPAPTPTSLKDRKLLEFSTACLNADGDLNQNWLDRIERIEGLFSYGITKVKDDFRIVIRVRKSLLPQVEEDLRLNNWCLLLAIADDTKVRLEALQCGDQMSKINGHPSSVRTF